MDTDWERISELDDLSTESSKNKKEEQKLKKKKKVEEGSKDWDAVTKAVTYTWWEYQKEKE